MAAIWCRVWGVFAGFLAALLLAGPPVAAQDKQDTMQRVLILYPYDNVQASSNQSGISARRRLLELSEGKIDFYNEFLDLRHFQDPAYQDWYAGNLAEKFRDKQIDLIFAPSEESYFFARDFGERFAPGVPIVFCCTPNEMISREHPDFPKVTGILTDFDVRKTIDLARLMDPDLEHVFVVGGGAAIDVAMTATFRSQLDTYDAGLDITYLEAIPTADLTAQLSTLPPHSAILYSLFLQDGDGVTHSSSFEYTDILAATANAPAYGPFMPYIFHGSIGGFIGTPDDSGAEAAELAWAILNGKDPAVTPIARSSAQKFRVDEGAAERFGLSLRNLPADTVILNHTPSLWEQYRGVVIATLAVLALQTGMIIALVAQTARRRLAENTARIAHADLARVTRRTTMGQMTASIAHEVNQPLAAIVANGSAALRWLHRPEPDIGEASQALERIRDEGMRAADIITTVRGMFGERSGDHAPLDFGEVVRGVLALCRGEIDDAGITLRSRIAANLPLIRGDRVQLQQVVLNLVTNAVDAMRLVAADRRNLTITLENAGPRIELRVTDSGTGIPSEVRDRVFEAFYTTKPNGMGMGLSICRSIVEAHNGTLSVEKSDTTGSTFLVAIRIGDAQAA